MLYETVVGTRVAALEKWVILPLQSNTKHNWNDCSSNYYMNKFSDKFIMSYNSRH